MKRWPLPTSDGQGGLPIARSGLPTGLYENNESRKFADIATNLALKCADVTGTKIVTSSDLHSLQQQWNTRLHGWTLTTPDYQSCQYRLLIFVALHPSCRSRIFLESVNTAVTAGHLKYSSAATYWAAIQTATRSLGQDKLPDAAKIMTWLEAKAASEPTIRLTCTMTQVIQVISPLPFHLIALIIITFVFGQRFSDMILCEIRAVTEIGDYIALTIYEGKVISSIGPYTMHIFKESQVGQLLLKIRRAAMDNGWTHLFIPASSTKAAETAICSLAMAEFGLRALRRGGLQAMGLAYATLDEILLFSRHQGIPMLNKYLQNGIVVLANAYITANVIAMTSITPLPWSF